MTNWEKIAGFIFGVVFMAAVMLIAVFLKDITVIQYVIFKTVLAIAAAGVVGIFSGSIVTKGSIGNKITIRATGALAVFLLVFIYTPEPPESNEGDTQNIESGGIGAQHTGSGDINIGISQEAYKQSLKEQESKIRQELKELYETKTENVILKSQLLEKQLAEVENKLSNVEESFQKRIVFLEKTITELQGFKDNLDELRYKMQSPH